MTMRYAHLSPGYLTNEIQLLDGPAMGMQDKGQKNPHDALRGIEDSQEC